MDQKNKPKGKGLNIYNAVWHFVLKFVVDCGAFSTATFTVFAQAETRAAASVSHGPRNTDPVKHSSSSPPSQTHGPKVKAGGSPKKSGNTKC